MGVAFRRRERFVSEHPLLRSEHPATHIWVAPLQLRNQFLRLLQAEPVAGLVAAVSSGGLMQIIQAVAACAVAADLQVADQQRRGGGSLDGHAEYLGWGVGVGTAG